ncbi:hypothetical protein HOG98_03270 [bacterium]|jgi:hypothetical protein|nr:hypothetical protein [bacterium]
MTAVRSFTGLIKNNMTKLGFNSVMQKQALKENLGNAVKKVSNKPPATNKK